MVSLSQDISLYGFVFFHKTVKNIFLRAQILREYINKMNPVVIIYACFNSAVHYLKPYLRLHNHKVESSILLIYLFPDIWHWWQNYKKKHMSTLTYLTFDKYWFLCYGSMHSIRENNDSLMTKSFPTLKKMNLLYYMSLPLTKIVVIRI